MKNYIESMIEEFEHDVNATKGPTWNDKLFKVSSSAKKLDDQRKVELHTFTMKAMFLCK